MAIYKSGHAEILKAIMAENSFEYPLTVDNTVITKLTIDAGNTALGTATIEGVYDSGMRGFTTVKYHRVDISKLFTDINTRVSVTSDNATKVSHVLSAVESQLGIVLTTADIVDEDLVTVPDSNEAIYSGNVVIVKDHPMFYGSFKITVSGIALDINTLITKREMDVIKDTSPHVNKLFNPTYYTYHVDYTASSIGLNAYKLGAKDYAIPQQEAADLGELLNEVDGLGWLSNNNTKKPFNLYGSVLVRHCKTSDFDIKALGVNTNYQYVMLIRPNSTWESTMASDANWGLMIHYDMLERME